VKFSLQARKLLVFIVLHFSSISNSSTGYDAGPWYWTWPLFGFELISFGRPL